MENKFEHDNFSWYDKPFSRRSLGLAMVMRPVLSHVGGSNIYVLTFHSFLHQIEFNVDGESMFIALKLCACLMCHPFCLVTCAYSETSGRPTATTLLRKSNYEMLHLNGRNSMLKERK